MEHKSLFPPVYLSFYVCLGNAKCLTREHISALPVTVIIIFCILWIFYSLNINNSFDEEAIICLIYFLINFKYLSIIQLFNILSKYV